MILSRQFEILMKRFVAGESRNQSALFPERLDEYIAEDNPVRVIDVFVDELDLAKMGFDRVQPQVTGRPGYHPATLLKIYVYGYLNRLQSSRRLERETQRNVELMWLTGRLMPDFKTIADFRKDNGKAIRRVCREFIELCRAMGFFAQAELQARFSHSLAYERPFQVCSQNDKMLLLFAGKEFPLSQFNQQGRH